MPAIGNISINDGKATPVAHVFSPTDSSGGKAELHNRAPALIAAWESLKVAVLRALGKTASHQVSIDLELPTYATVEGVDTVVRTQKFRGTFYLSQQGSAAERKDLRVLVMNALANASIVAAIENVEPIY